MRALRRELVAKMDRFWFAERACESLAVWRVAFGLYFLGILLMSVPNWARFYGPEGTYPVALLRSEGAHVWTVFALSDSSLWLWSIFFLLVAAASCFTFGLFTRLSCAVLFVGQSSMMTRNIYMVNGQDQVAAVLLFFACFAPLNGAFSLDRRRQKKPQFGEIQTAWALRLMQLTFAGIYLFCGPTKWPSWSDGNAIYYISLSHAWFRFPGEAVFRSHELSQTLSYATVCLETLFPFLVWIRTLRPWLLAAMALMHLTIMVLLSAAVFYFNLVMLVGLLLFVDGRAMRGLYRDIERSHKYHEAQEDL